MTTMTGKTNATARTNTTAMNAPRSIVSLECRSADDDRQDLASPNRVLIAAYEEHIDATHHEAARSRRTARIAMSAVAVLGVACVTGTWWSTRTVTAQRSEIASLLGELDSKRARLTEAVSIIDDQERALDEALTALAYTRAERDADRPLINERDRLINALTARGGFVAREEFAPRGFRPVATAPMVASAPTDDEPATDSLVMFPFKTE